MKNLNWRKATLAQLYEIVYNDDGASRIHKGQAFAELERRKHAHRSRMHGKLNYREKVVHR